MPSLMEFQTALERCMQAEPPSGPPYYELSPDASRLTDVFAEMLYTKEDSRSLDALSTKQRDAFERWKS